MRGITNAQGVSGPYLTETLAPLIRRISLLENNPPVGSVTTFAGFDWVVVHWDTENGVMYMALKDIYSMTQFAETSSGVTYENSTLKQQSDDFANMLTVERKVGSSEAFHHSLAGVFVPTESQLVSKFVLFKHNPEFNVRPNYGYGIANYQGQAVPWWTSTVVNVSEGGSNFSDVAFCFKADGTYGSTLATMQTAGFRPFICVKMR